MKEVKFFAENKTNYKLTLVQFGIILPPKWNPNSKIEVREEIANLLENNDNIIITRATVEDGKVTKEQDSQEFKEVVKSNRGKKKLDEEVVDKVAK